MRQMQRRASAPNTDYVERDPLRRAFSLALLALAVLLATMLSGRVALAAPPTATHADAAISYLRDPTALLGLDAIRQRADQGAFQGARKDGNTRDAHLNFGMTRDAIWLRVPLHNDSARTAERLVEIDYPYLDDVEFHVPAGLPGGPVNVLTGDRRPFDSRGFLHRNFVLPVALGPGESTEVFIRVKSAAAVQIPVRVHSVSEFASLEQFRLLLIGAYFGLALMMVVYNLALCRALREPAYPAYVAFVGLFGLFHFCLNGFAYQYFYPRSPHLGNLGAYLFLGPALAAATQFARAFLGSRELMPRLDRLARALIVPLAAMAPIALVVDAQWVVMLSQALALVGCALWLTMGIHAWRLGYTPARWYVLAFVTVILSGTSMVLRNLGVLGLNPLTFYGTQIGAGLEALFLGLALAERIRAMQVEALDAQRRALDASRRAERNLANEVAASTAELAATNSRLRQEIRERERAEAGLRASEERLRQLAQRDPLTGVANRHLLSDRGGALLASAQRHQRFFGVIALDLDGLKGVNDALGHGAGDQLLVACTQRLGARLRRSDLLARTGGDEFVILLPDIEGRTELAYVAAQLRDACEQPLTLEGGEVLPRASFGTALFPEDGADLEALLGRADQQMYRDKHARRTQRAPLATHGADSTQDDPQNCGAYAQCLAVTYVGRDANGVEAAACDASDASRCD